MDQNGPVLTSEPTPKSANGLISLVTGILAWVLSIIFRLMDLPMWIAGILAFVAAILAIVFGNKAKREDPANKAGKTGKLLGWLYLIGIILVVVLLVLGLALGISALSGLFA